MGRRKKFANDDDSNGVDTAFSVENFDKVDVAAKRYKRKKQAAKKKEKEAAKSQQLKLRELQMKLAKEKANTNALPANQQQDAHKKVMAKLDAEEKKTNEAAGRQATLPSGKSAKLKLED